jgi:hypothetical protein
MHYAAVMESWSAAVENGIVVLSNFGHVNII